MQMQEHGTAIYWILEAVACLSSAICPDISIEVGMAYIKANCYFSCRTNFSFLYLNNIFVYC